MFSSESLNELAKLYVKLSNSKCVGLGEVPDQLRNYLMSGDLAYVGLDNNLCIKSTVKLALELIGLGLDVELVSKSLNWRDFESLVGEYLGLNNYYVIKNLRFSNRRFEVDVLGIDQVSALAVAIDCKHWSPGYGKRGRITNIASEHRAKVEELSKGCRQLLSKHRLLSSVEVFIPIIVTLTDIVRGYVGGSFVVPILRFNDFIANVRYYLEALTEGSGGITNKCFDRV